MNKDNSNKKVNTKFFIAIICLFVVSSLVFVGTCIFAAYSNRETHGLSFDWSIEDEESEDMYVKISKGTPWVKDDLLGCEYNMSVVNKTDYTIEGWSVSVTVGEDCFVDGYWNGEWTREEDKLVFVPNSLYGKVYSDSERAFGFVMYSESEYDLNEITITYKQILKASGYPVFWISAILMIICFLAAIMMYAMMRQFNAYARTHTAYKDLVEESLKTIANIIDTKDEYTRGHSVRVAIYSRMLAKRMGLPEHEQERIYYIGLLHDIGKIGVPKSILTKPGRLSDEEFELIKKHPNMGASIIKDFHSIENAIYGIRYHHEKYDGSGYNEGLKGKEIPLEGRIICVADSYDAMSSRRCYRNSLSYDYILNELKSNSGKQFDPDIVKHMIDLVEGGYAPVSEEEMELIKVID